MKGIVEWHDWICECLHASLEQAQPTGDPAHEPRAIVSFSIEFIEQMLAESPLEQSSKK